MTFLATRRALLQVTLALVLAACAAGGGETGTGATSTTVGVITRFGSVFVNGVEYFTDSASVEMDGAQVAGENELKIGMVVTLIGSDNGNGTGNAESIRFTDEAQGFVITNNILVDRTLNVMGQTVIVGPDATFEGNNTYPTPDTLDINARVEVSGFSTGTGQIHATRIEVKDPLLDPEIEVKGIISQLGQAGPGTFTLGSLAINYNGLGAADLPETTLRDGLYVQVKSTAAPLAAGLVATRIELENGGEKGVKGAEGEELELEGIVSEVPSASELWLNGQRVLAGDGIEFLITFVNTKLRVHGHFNANGILVADEIEQQLEGDLERFGLIEAVNGLDNTITLGGETILVTNTTIMNDERNQQGFQPERYFGFGHLALGDWITVRAYQNGAILVATRLERDDAP